MGKYLNPFNLKEPNGELFYETRLEGNTVLGVWKDTNTQEMCLQIRNETSDEILKETRDNKETCELLGNISQELAETVLNKYRDSFNPKGEEIEEDSEKEEESMDYSEVTIEDIKEYFQTYEEYAENLDEPESWFEECIKRELKSTPKDTRIFYFDDAESDYDTDFDYRLHNPELLRYEVGFCNYTLAVGDFHGFRVMFNQISSECALYVDKANVDKLCKIFISQLGRKNPERMLRDPHFMSEGIIKKATKALECEVSDLIIVKSYSDVKDEFLKKGYNELFRREEINRDNYTGCSPDASLEERDKCCIFFRRETFMNYIYSFRYFSGEDREKFIEAFKEPMKVDIWLQ